jgi:CMP-N-acetylneuraminic acid synthetase
MIYAILIGRAKSKGFPNKNIKKINNKHLFEFPIIACQRSKIVDKIFVSTDSNIIKKKIKKISNVEIINRSKKLATDKALGEDVFLDAYLQIKKKYKKNKIEFLILLFANSVTLSKKMLTNGVEFLRKNPSFDSAVSTSVYNMWSPLRARKLDKRGALVPFVPFKTFGNPKTLNCDRDSQGDVYFADMSCSIIRPECLENMKDNLLPQKWMGKKIAPIKSWGGLDIDYEWQLPQVKYWLKKNKIK